MPKQIFILGATGYIGGAILTHLLRHLAETKTTSDFEITCLTRTPAKAAKLDGLGVKTIQGDLNSIDLLQDQASKSDIVIAAANADVLETVQALFHGFEKRKSSVKPIYIHTSGTGVLLDAAAGMHTSETIYKDTDTEQMNSIDPKQPHREVDIFIADNSAKVDTFVVIPPTIYGIGNGPDLRLSHQVPWMIRTAIQHKKAYHIGKGINIWTKVHIEDLADLYVTIFAAALEGKAPKGREGFYFAETGEYTFGKVSAVIAKTLNELGVSKETKAFDCPKGQDAEIYGAATQGIDPWFVLGGNSRARAEKARKVLKWQPKHDSDKDFYDDVAFETKYIYENKA